MAHNEYFKQPVKDELLIDNQVQRRLDYRDIDHFVPKQNIKDIHQTLKILKSFQNKDVKIRYWEKLLSVGKDSPGCFIEMMKNTNAIKYRFHNTINENELAWVFKKLQVDPKHRIEMLTPNVDLIELVKDLNAIWRYKIQIIFNIGKNSHLLNNVLYSVEKIVWLNLSNSDLMNSKIYSMVQVINRGNLSNMKAIILTNNPKIHMLELQQDLKKLTKGRLQYLECDLENEIMDSNEPILEELHLNSEFKLMSDAKKLRYLQNSGIIEVENENIKDECIIIDYGICDGGWNERVKLGLADSYNAKSYKVKLDRKAAISMERVVSDKISTSMTREEFAIKKPLLKLKVKKGSKEKSKAYLRVRQFYK